jgi:hypothetical protein
MYIYIYCVIVVFISIMKPFVESFWQPLYAFGFHVHEAGSAECGDQIIPPPPFRRYKCRSQHIQFVSLVSYTGIYYLICESYHFYKSPLLDPIHSQISSVFALSTSFINSYF